jgi:hypothetical protein
MTNQDLKNNREELISFINERGFDLKFAMNMCVELCESVEDIEELKNELDFNLKPRQRKDSKNASILGKLEQLEVENN